MSNQAVILKSKGASLAVESRPVPTPAPLDIVVKNHAIATNPVDWKMQDTGFFIESYPIILGSDLSGVVEAVGSSVTHFQKGDRVTGFGDVLSSKDSRNGAFQEYTVVKACAAAKIPPSMSFEEGSILPMAVATAAVGIFLTLGVPRPPTQQQGVFIVWGASSSVGTAAVQIARSLGYTVYAINSPKHNSYVKSLGATECFDYNDPEVTKKVTDAIKTSGSTASLAYDCISEHGSAPQCVKIISACSGGGKVCLTLPYPEDGPKPDNVEIVSTYAARIVTDAQEFGAWLMNDWLEGALLQKTYVPSPAIQKIEGGLEKVQSALEIHKKGLSGIKLVLPL